MTKKTATTSAIGYRPLAIGHQPSSIGSSEGASTSDGAAMSPKPSTSRVQHNETRSKDTSHHARKRKDKKERHRSNDHDESSKKCKKVQKSAEKVKNGKEKGSKGEIDSEKSKIEDSYKTISIVRNTLQHFSSVYHMLSTFFCIRICINCLKYVQLKVSDHLVRDECTFLLNFYRKKNIEPSSPIIRCPYCQLTFDNERKSLELLMHLQISHSDESVDCIHCNESISISQLPKHSHSHIKNCIKDSFRCKQCNTKFKGCRTFLEHIYSHGKTKNMNISYIGKYLFSKNSNQRKVQLATLAILNQTVKTSTD